jgi:hypothetical protein
MVDDTILRVSETPDVFKVYNPNIIEKPTEYSVGLACRLEGTNIEPVCGRFAEIPGIML